MTVPGLFRAVTAKKAIANVAIYVRVSTEEQAVGHSLDFQRDACRAHAEKLGASQIEVFEDAGFSGTTANRPAFQRLIDDAEAGRIDAVIIYKGDRFARKRLDALVYKERLRKAGVKLINVTEPFDDSPAGLISEGMTELIAEWFSRDLSHKVGAGLRKRAEKGLPNAMVPFGYQQSAIPAVEPPTIIPDESRAVRMAYECFSTGTVSYNEIARRFNAEGWRTRHRAPKGRPEDGPRIWTGDSIRKLIQNPFYRGVVVYHEADEFPGRHEAIVTQELWDRANTVGTRLRGKATSYRPVHFYPLAGILKCAGCGSNLQGNASRCGEKYRYYRETAHRRGVPCDQPQIAVRADRIEAEVDQIVARFRMPGDVRERVLALLRDQQSPADSEAERARIREKLRRIARLYADMELAEVEYDSQRRRLEAELERMTVPVEKAEQAADQFDLLQLAWSRAEPEEKRGLGLALFEAIYFDLESMEIAEVVTQPAFRPWLGEETTG